MSSDAYGSVHKVGLDCGPANCKPSQNKTRSFRNMVMWYFQGVRPQCSKESFYMIKKLKIFDAYCVYGFCGHGNTELENEG